MIAANANHREPDGVVMLMFPLVFIRLRKRLAAARHRIAMRNLERQQVAFADRIEEQLKRGCVTKWRHETHQRVRQRRAALRFYFNRMLSYKAVVMMQRRHAWSALDRLLSRGKAARCFQVWRRLAIASKAFAVGGRSAAVSALEKFSADNGWTELDAHALSGVEVVSKEDESHIAATFTQSLLRTILRHWKLFVAMSRKEKADLRRLDLWLQKERPRHVKLACLTKWARALRNATAVSVYVSSLQRRCVGRWTQATAATLHDKALEASADEHRRNRVTRAALTQWSSRFRQRAMLAHLGTVVAIQHRLAMLPAALAVAQDRVASQYVACFVAWRSFAQRRRDFLRFMELQHTEYCRALAARAFAVLKAKGSISWETGQRDVSSDTNEDGNLLNATLNPHLAATFGGTFSATTGSLLSATTGGGAAAASVRGSSVAGSPMTPARTRGRSAARALSPHHPGSALSPVTDAEIRIALPRPISSASNGSPFVAFLASGSVPAAEWSLRHPINWQAVRGVERQLRHADPARLPERLRDCLKLLPADTTALPAGISVASDDDSGSNSHFIATFARRDLQARRRKAEGGAFYDGGYLVDRVCQALFLFAHAKRHLLAAASRTERQIQFAVTSHGAVAQAFEKALEDEMERGVAPDRVEDLQASSIRNLQSVRAERIREFLTDRTSKVAAVRARLRQQRLACAAVRFRDELPPELVRMDLPDVDKVVAFFNGSIARNAFLLRSQRLHQRVALSRWELKRTLPLCHFPARPPPKPASPKRKTRQATAAARPSPPPPLPWQMANQKKSAASRSPRRAKDLLSNKYAIPEHRIQLLVELAARSLMVNVAKARFRRETTGVFSSLMIDGRAIGGVAAASSGSAVPLRSRPAEQPFSASLSRVCLVPPVEETQRVQVSMASPDRFDTISSSSRSTRLLQSAAVAASLTGATSRIGAPAALLASAVARKSLSSPRNSVVSTTSSPSERDAPQAASSRQQQRSPEPASPQWQLPAGVDPFLMTLTVNN